MKYVTAIRVVPVEHGDVDVVSGEVGVPGDEGHKLGPAEDEGHGRQVALHGAVGAAKGGVRAPHDHTHQSYHLENRGWNSDPGLSFPKNY